ncbi:hypothetical protein VTJ49DRAFT_6358 [Mycothermus thermophilus]|uniref:Zn(2)-C6 fungal-type domain-containing protein n=1 Tax=Humicola insolens TaxID=85995 RepID=A0ABR3VPY3_HUMIN
MGSERMERQSARVEQRRRRKIPLACEPCRERKSRCDGAKPICSTCQRRALPLHHCVYILENARTASNEAYIKVLHDRIRRLEKTCADHGLPIPPLDPTAGDPGSSPDQVRHTLPPLNPATAMSDHAASPSLRPPPSEPSPDHDRLDATESAASVTAMGTVSTEHDVCQAFETANEFYGSSSAASFMKEACTSVKPHRAPPGDSTAGRVPGFSASFAPPGPSRVPQFSQAGRFVLPPRSLADHLLTRFFERVYWLHPFFHKPTFLQAYESLWRPAHELPEERPSPGLGLGSPGADASTIVFHSALNAAFALGAQFSDLNGKDKATAVETFFNRGKSFVCLDFIDMNNMGVVQALLLMGLLLQSTPFPSRCWNAVGLACRVAQGLGLHAESGRTSRSPLETEIRRRTWHGCVTLDMIVSMIYGRPTMTAHVPHLPLPTTAEYDDAGDLKGRTRETSSMHPSKMTFYAEYIRQCRILGEILSNVYTGACISTSQPSSLFDHSKTRGMDAILELDAKLSQYEAALPAIMSWTSPCDISGLDEERRSIIVTQRTVLRASFLYLRLMLHRPILTQLCSNTEPASEQGAPAVPGPSSTAGQELFTSFAAGCARICLGAAMDLIELVQATYRTNTTGGWWWDGLYTLTAGLAVIVGYLSPPLLASLDRHRLERSWMMCQEILEHLASFTPAQGEMANTGQDVAAHHQHDDGMFQLGGGFQWQLPTGVGSDILDTGLLFNWDQSLDFLTGGLVDSGH